MGSRLVVPYLVLFATAWPLYEYYEGWPAFRRIVTRSNGRARLDEYRKTVALQWLVTGAAGLLWLGAGRALPELGMRAPVGRRLWAALVLAGALASLYGWQALRLQRSEKGRERVRASVAALDPILPHSAVEFRWFLVVSLTAAFCEEFLYRGYFLVGLAPLTGFWPAVFLSALSFGLLHAYQGRRGVVRTAVVGLAMSGVVGLTHSLVPAMAMHGAIDIGSGTCIWISLGVTPDG